MEDRSAITLFAKLEEALEKERLVSVHTNPDDPDACSVGYVDALTTTHLRLRSVTTTGRRLGYEIRRIADVLEVETDSPYLARVRKLESAEPFVDVEAPDTGNFIRDAVEAAQRSGAPITLFRIQDDEGITGHVAATTDLRVTIRVIDRFGNDEGVESIPWRDIDGLDYGTEEEQARGFLNREQD